SYSWSPSTFLNNTTIANPMAVGVTASTTYTVTVSNAPGCNSTGTATVTTGAALSGSISTTSSNLCIGQSATLSADFVGGGAPYSYTWSPGGQTTQTISVTPSTATSYTVSVLDNCGANASANTSIAVTNPTPVITPGSATICQGVSVGLSASSIDAVNYS